MTFKTLLMEAIYGNMATVYHRTRFENLSNSVYTGGFKPGGGDTYGKGFYSTYELEYQLRKGMEKMYGHVVVKFAVPIDNFFVFDYSEFIKSPQYKQIELKFGETTSKNFIHQQIKFFKIKFDSYDPSIEKFSTFKFSADIVTLLLSKSLNFKKSVRGVIFTGRNDGKVLASYDAKTIIPLSYTKDEGKTWIKVEKDREYIKKVIKKQTVDPKHYYSEKIKSPKDIGIDDYEFTKDGLLNCNCDVDISDKKLSKFPFKFGIVKGDFMCSDSNITSLEGAPKSVSGDFHCDNNNITSLEGAPKTVGGTFSCLGNKLSSLRGAPKTVGKNFICSNNNLTNLEGAPEHIEGYFWCDGNKLPKEVVLKSIVKGKIMSGNVKIIIENK